MFVENSAKGDKTMWANESVFYQIYPLGFCGAPFENDGNLVSRIKKVEDWIPHIQKLGANAIYFSPVFESDTHGYNTRDYTKIDCRLGTNEDFKEVVDKLHAAGIKVVLDGVFNHVGRGFWAFQDVLKNRWDSPYKDWFHISFDGNSNYNDGLWYEGWEGNFDLVKLNLRNEEVIQHILSCVKGWIDEFSDSSAPYTSTIVLLVRKGNPKHISDWDDLVKKNVDVITPDPKSSGGACWNFLAALSYAKTNYDSLKEQKSFMKKLYENVTIMDSGARGSTTTFVENGQGDVLIAWENEALTTMDSYPGKYEIVNPSVSILAQPSVAIVDDNAKSNGTQEVSKEYLQYLYSDEAQQLIGESGYRPTNQDILNRFSDKFDLNIRLWSIEDYGGWNEAYKTYFDDGAMFDEIYGN